MSDIHLVVVSVVLAIAMLGALLLWLIPGECRCEKCGFHVNERRMADAKQKELQHDQQHKGWGWQTNTQDWMKCDDPECPRNPR